MIEQTLFDELQLKYPDGFHVLSEEERSRLHTLEDGEWVGLSNPEEHILISLGRKKINGFASKILNDKDLTGKMKKEIRRALQSFDYKGEADKQCLIGGRKARGMGYEYTSQGIDMYAESYLVKKGNILYYFHFYVRNALKNDSLALWSDMLEGITWL